MVPPLLAQAHNVLQTIAEMFTFAAGHLQFWSVVGAVLPALLLVWYFYSRDANPEPRRVVLITFLLGVLISLPILLVGLPIRWLLIDLMPIDPVSLRSDRPFLMAGAEGFLGAALPEEFFKFLVVWWYCSRHRAFDEPMDGVVYGVTASLGFAALENVLYATSNNFWVIVGRAATAVPMHAFLGAIMGYHIGQWRFGKEGRGRMFLLGFFFPFLLHGLYDFFLMVPMFASSDWAEANAGLTMLVLGLGLGVLIVAGVWTFALVAKLRRQQGAYD